MTAEKTKTILILLLTIFSFGWTHKAFSQPYVYHTITISDTLGLPSFENLGINRFNLATGIDEEYLENGGAITKIHTNDDQSMLFLQKGDADLEIIRVNDPNSSSRFLNSIGWLHYIVDAKEADRLYLFVGDLEFPNKAVLLNRASFEPEDTLRQLGINYYAGLPNDKPFLSGSGQNIFEHISDSTGIYFRKINGTTGSIIDEEIKCGNIENVKAIPALKYGKRGFAVVAWGKKYGYLHRNYVICDADDTQITTKIRFPWRTKTYLSPNTDHVIFERVNFIKNNPNGEGPEFHTGQIYIFDSRSGKLTQRLTLPAKGQIFLHDDYSETLFYIDNFEDPAIQVALNQIALPIELLDPLLADLSEAVSQDWLGDASFATEREGQLQQVRSQLVAGDFAQAAATLSGFIGLVEAVNAGNGPAGATLTSEGYALLYFNARYLADRLPEP